MGNKFAPDIVNPLDQIAYKIKKAKDKERIIPIIEIIIGAQLDPIVGLFNAGFGPDEDFEDNMMDALVYLNHTDREAEAKYWWKEKEK